MNHHSTVVKPWQRPQEPIIEPKIIVLNANRETGRNIRKIISWINIGWTGWALAGGFYFMLAGASITEKTVWDVFGTATVVGVSLLACGIFSLLGIMFKRMNRAAALFCALWCLATAVVLQFDTPEFDQGDIDAWLLLICSFTCVMRWALVTLEPYLDK